MVSLVLIHDSVAIWLGPARTLNVVSLADNSLWCWRLSLLGNLEDAFFGGVLGESLSAVTGSIIWLMKVVILGLPVDLVVVAE